MSSPGTLHGMAAVMPFYPTASLQLLTNCFQCRLPCLAHIVQRRAALPAGRGAPQAGLSAVGLGCSMPRFLLAEGGRRCPRGLATPLLPSPSRGAQPQPAPSNLETARFTSIHESVTSACFCASLQQAAGLCGWNFLLFCNTSFFFFFAFHLFKTRKWSIT